MTDLPPEMKQERPRMICYICKSQISNARNFYLLSLARPEPTIMTRDLCTNCKEGVVMYMDGKRLSLGTANV